MRYSVMVNGSPVELELDGHEVRVAGADAFVQAQHAELSRIGDTPLRLVRIGDRVHHVVARREEGKGRYTLWVDGWRYDVEALDERTRAIRELAKAVAGPAGPAPLVAPMPGLVVRVYVEVGAEVHPGQPLVAMEAMKMENELRAQSAGKVKAVHAAAGAAVEKGTILLEME